MDAYLLLMFTHVDAYYAKGGRQMPTGRYVRTGMYVCMLEYVI